MESINKTLNKLMNKETFQKRYEAIRAQVLTNQDVQEFLSRHQISHEIVEKHIMKLYEYIGQCKNCSQCESLEKCPNILKGYQPHLVFTGRSIEIKYEKCTRKIADELRKKQKTMIESLHIPKEILHASMADLSLEESGRLEAIKLANDFLTGFEAGKKKKGLYLYGSFGTGKTYILGAIANELANKHIPSMIVYVPEFFRELKGSLQDQSLSAKIEAVKKVQVLMLDDIGAESMSSWLRDDVLGPILQYRMMENLPTFFTSNFNFDELQHHFSYTQRGEEEKVKAARIMERIKYLATPVEVKGKNFRF